MDFDVLRTFVASAPMDWIILGALLILIAFDVLRNGASRACAVALALPGAVLLKSLLPSAFLIGDLTAELSTSVLDGVLFLILFASLYLLVRRMDRSYAGEGGQAIQALLCGGATVATLVVIWLQVPALAALWQFGDDVVAIFGGGFAFWWLLGSYSVLAFLRD